MLFHHQSQQAVSIRAENVRLLSNDYDIVTDRSVPKHMNEFSLIIQSLNCLRFATALEYLIKFHQ